jgi:hypothetical protein
LSLFSDPATMDPSHRALSTSLPFTKETSLSIYYEYSHKEQPKFWYRIFRRCPNIFRWLQPPWPNILGSGVYRRNLYQGGDAQPWYLLTFHKFFRAGKVAYKLTLPQRLIFVARFGGMSRPITFPSRALMIYTRGLVVHD